MISLTNTATQTLAPGQALTFNQVVSGSGCDVCHMANTPSVKLRMNSVYEIHFSGNITSATAGTPVQLSIQTSGVTIPYSTMISTPSVANALNNVAKTILLKNCCCDYDRITVVNTGTTPVIVDANSMFFIHKLN